MLVFFALGNAKVLSFALGNAKLPDASSFASQWNIGFNHKVSQPISHCVLILLILKILISFRDFFRITQFGC